jgi:octaprenyl-diphosphate synthase
LLARSLSIAAETGRTDVIRIVADITEKMSQGEIHQMLNKGALDLTEDEYLQVISNKTAALFKGACRFAAIIADAPDDHEQALSQYGFHLGLAFQMVDDLLDYTVDSAILGKRIGADLREGKLTLPVIHALQEAAAGDRQRMVRIIQNRNFSNSEFHDLIELLKTYGGIDYTRQKAAEHIQIATRALALFDDCPAKRILMDIAQYAMLRNM